MSKFVMVFDTETTSLDKPFCYDVGYFIIDTETFEAAKDAHYVIEQNWHNLPLFESAYYKDKRPQYVSLMRTRNATMKKWGYVMQDMIRDIEKYEITDAYAYNSDFDEKVFNFNCEWFKTINPFDNVAIHDIWGYASQFITFRQEYKDFCEKYELFTDSGNYKGSAESVYQFLTNNPEFVEAHMGLYDSEIEASILVMCVREFGAKWSTDYKVNKIIERPKQIPFVIKINNQVIYDGKYTKKTIRNNVFSFKI